MLEATNSTVWKICRTKESEIAGVFVNSYRGIAVPGVDFSVPVLGSMDRNPDPNCSETEARYLWSKISSLKKPVTRIDIYKKNIDQGVVVGTPPTNTSELICSSDRKIEDFMDPL